MKTFAYHARTAAGVEVDGVTSANTVDEAIANLRGNGLVVATIKEEGDSKGDIRSLIGPRKIKDKTLSVLCAQLAIIMQSGLPLPRALRMVADQTTDKALSRIFLDVADDITAGSGLADSFVRYGSNLPATFIETVRAGEESGNLDVVFNNLARYYDKSARASGKVKSAMIYPAFVLGVAVVVVIVIMLFAVPTFKSTFESFGGELPLPTQVMMGVSDFMVAWWPLLLAIVVALFIGFRVALRNERFHMAASRLFLRIPVLGKIAAQGSTAQFSSTMSMMVQAGLPMPKAVDVCSRSIANYSMAAALGPVVGELEAGHSLAGALRRTNAYPDLACEMVEVGEETGSLHNTLSVLSDYYDNETAVATERALSLLEPLTIVVLALIVVMILLAVYLPMFSIYGSFNSTL